MEEKKRVSAISIAKSANDVQSIQVEAYNEMVALGKIVVKPTFNREELTMCYLNSTNRRCINAKASVIAGMGYRLTDEESAKSSGVADFFNNLYNKDGVPKPFSTLLKELWTDAETYGESGLECIRIGSTIENLMLFSGRCMVKDANRKDIYQLNKVKNKVATFRRYGKATKEYNDVLSLTFETAEDAYYGVPCYVSAIDSIKKVLKIDYANAESINNIVDPSLLLIVNGYPIGNDEMEEATTVLKGLKEKRSSAGIINFGDKDANISVHNTGAGTLEGNYQTDKTAIALEIMALHGITPELFGVLTNGGISSGEKATGALKIFVQTVVRPAQEMLERLIMMFIKREFPSYKGDFKLNTIDLTDSLEDSDTELKTAQTYQAYINTGSKELFNEYRVRIGMNPVEDEEWNKLKVQTGTVLNLVKGV